MSDLTWHSGHAKNVVLAHGAGGRETSELLWKVLISKLENEEKRVQGGFGTDVLDDGATLPIGEGQLVISIDSYTISPLFFPGGDIGILAACGSINDVLMMGGVPVALMDSIVVEEGFSVEDLDKVTNSMINVLRKEGVALIGGDLKVMPRGQLDKIIITTVGIGIASKPIVDTELKPGDKVLVTGTVGDHGATIMAIQHGIDVDSTKLRSDVAPLSKLMVPLLERYGDYVHAAQDPTRGGVAMTLNEWANKNETVIVVDEERIPVREEVRSYSEMLGIDPLYLANEGMAVLGVDGEIAEEVLKFVRELGYRDAEIIGEVRTHERFKGMVLLRTIASGVRLLEPPTGELVPRIC